MSANRKIQVMVYDSLDNKIADYDTTISPESYSKLLSIADENNIAIIDCEVDGELGVREYYL